MQTARDIRRVIAHSSQLDERRGRYTVYVSWVILPVLVFFPLVNDYTGLLAGVLIALAAVIAFGNILIYASNWSRGKTYLPYLGATVAAFCLLYFAYLGYGEGASLMWIFVFPMMAMFMLGLGAGVLFCLAALSVCAAMMILGPEVGAYAYSYEFITRFTLSFSLVVALTFGYEYWRVRLELEKEDVNAELNRTRQELDAIAGLANVCAWCKAVKTQDGTWLSLEKYVARTEAAAVSHAICPDCVAREKERIR